MPTLITFGQAHVHQIGDVLINHNTVAVVRDRDHAFELFGSRWSFEYPIEKLEDEKFLSYFPRGVIVLIEEENSDDSKD